MKQFTFPGAITISVFLILVAFGNKLAAQCPFDPVIEGDTILCPEGSTELKTQAYEMYQWYRRPWGGNQADPIPGATGQSLALTEVDALNFYSVEATLSGCTENSPEVLLDVWAFVLPTLSYEGNYEFDPNTQTFSICEGDTMLLVLSPPYAASITWYNNGLPIPGETGISLPVTQTGAYQVVGAPAICPNFILSPGVITDVVAEVCNAVAEPTPAGLQVSLFPNPVADQLYIRFSSASPAAMLQLIDLYGREILQQELVSGTTVAQLDVRHLLPGTYFLQLHFAEGKSLAKKMVKH